MALAYLPGDPFAGACFPRKQAPMTSFPSAPNSLAPPPIRPTIPQDPTSSACSAVLERRLQSSPGVLHAVLATADGRALAHALRSNVDAVPARISAIASSLLALGESFTRETLKSPASYTSIASEQGSIVIVRVPSSTGAYTLCLSADRSETFAMALRFALDAASELAAVIDRA